MRVVGKALTSMPLPVFEELEYSTEESILFTEEVLVEDFLDFKILKKDQIDEMIEKGLGEIFSDRQA
jgi:hypothetical protein